MRRSRRHGWPTIADLEGETHKYNMNTCTNPKRVEVVSQLQWLDIRQPRLRVVDHRFRALDQARRLYHAQSFDHGWSQQSHHGERDRVLHAEGYRFDDPITALLSHPSAS